MRIFWNRSAFEGCLLLFALASAPASAAELCPKLPKPAILRQGPHDLLQTWIVSDVPRLHSGVLGELPALREFRSEVRKRVADVSADSILDQEYRDFLSRPDPRFRAEAAKIRLILDRRVGEIRPLNCLESHLFSIQLLRQSMVEKPSEFGAFILRRDSDLKIYYSTQDRPGGKLDDQLMDSVAADLASGWTMWKHLHNHNFFFDGSVPIMGGVCPSRSDVQLYLYLQKELGLNAASVTNGFDTIDLDAEDFQVLGTVP